jgi:DNA-binding GntR family transcriptional regulator
MEPFTRRLGLSRTPVREAILRLEKEGFVEIHPRLGTLVSRLDLRQIREMYQVRSLLEGAAARQVAGTIPASRIAALEEELRSYTLGENADLKAISQSGVKVHRLIVESCENRVLAGVIESLHEHFRRFRSLSLEIPAKVLSSHQDHLVILDALKRGDGEAAERLIHAHFERAVRFLLDAVVSHGPLHIPVTL